MHGGYSGLIGGHQVASFQFIQCVCVIRLQQMDAFRDLTGASPIPMMRDKPKTCKFMKPWHEMSDIEMCANCIGFANMGYDHRHSARPVITTNHHQHHPHQHHPHHHHSPLTTHHSPLTTHHSPLTTHQSQLTTHHSPPATAQADGSVRNNFQVSIGAGSLNNACGSKSGRCVPL